MTLSDSVRTLVGLSREPVPQLDRDAESARDSELRAAMQRALSAHRVARKAIRTSTRDVIDDMTARLREAL
jgi:hypothetical protein